MSQPFVFRIPTNVSTEVRNAFEKIAGVLAQEGFPTFSIGTVTMRPAGEDPTVTITGTPSHIVLNFGIPAGADGADGADGEDGADGAAGPEGPPGPAGANGLDGTIIDDYPGWTGTIYPGFISITVNKGLITAVDQP
jgi:hypothetical protein